MRTIAIDCGASFLKGAVFSEDGTILAKRQHHAPAIRRNGEIDEPVQITELFLNVEKMLDELASEGGENKYKLCISNEMHGFLLADKKGNPITDYISWQKEYGNIPVNGISAMEELQRENGEDVLYTGMKLRGSLPSCNLLYLWKSGFFQGKDEKLHFYTLGDYILRKLSGKEPLCHPTNAAATGLYDLRKGNWSKKLTARYVDYGIVFPQIGQETIDFERGGKFFCAYPAIGDHQAALLGAGLRFADEISFNLGTGAQVARLAKEIEPSYEYQTRPYFYGYYLKAIPHLPSGRALNVYFRLVKDVLGQFGIRCDDGQIWNKVLEAEQTGEATGIKCDLSFFENPLTSVDRGSIEDIGEYDLTLGNLFRAVFGQMADNFNEAADRLCRGQEGIKKLIFSGGIARKFDPIRNRIVEKYGENMECIVADDETLIGLYQYSNLPIS